MTFTCLRILCYSLYSIGRGGGGTRRRTSIRSARRRRRRRRRQTDRGNDYNCLNFIAFGSQNVKFSNIVN